MQVIDFGRIRRFLGMTQFDVAVATGVPLGRVGASERGRVQLNHCEELASRNFLERRLKVFFESEQEESAQPGAVPRQLPEALKNGETS